MSPTLRSELRRSFLPYNLMVAAGTGLFAGAAAALATRSLAVAAAASAAVFTLVTLLHTAAHAYFGWRFGRGLRAAGQGRHALAARLLAPAARPGLSHYDPDGAAREALRRSMGVP